MSRLLQTVRITRLSLPRRVKISRPSTMIRGYPARTQMDDADLKVFPLMELKAKDQAREEEKNKSLMGDDKLSHIIDHAPGWNESLASESEAYVSSHVSIANFPDQSREGRFIECYN